MYENGLTQKFRIYCGERYAKSGGGKSHSYLALVDDEINIYGGHTIYDRLHFDGKPYYDPDGSFRFVIAQKEPGRTSLWNIEDYDGELACLFVDDKEQVQAMWAHGKMVAQKIEGLKERFHFDGKPNEVDCRSGTMVVSAKMGLKMPILNKNPKGSSGTQSGLENHPGLKDIPVFDQHMQPV